jgi:hypothetical protein
VRTVGRGERTIRQDDPDRRPASGLLAALAVPMLCILATFDTADAWLVLVTAVSIALIALVVVIDLWRVVDATGDDAQRE